MTSHYTSSLSVELGRMDFIQALELQRKLRNLRSEGKIPDVFLFLEHFPVFTVGRHPEPSNFVGVPVVETERGGDVTYHGPGQLVIYPIRDVRIDGNMDVRKFVNLTQAWVIRSLESLGFRTHLGNEPGIWVYNTPNGDRKVASIGMAIKDSVSMHGVSINLSEEVLEGFNRIRPCGMSPEVMGYIGIGRDRVINAMLSELDVPCRNVEREEFLLMANNAYSGSRKLSIMSP